jgi:hypothetical protein
MRARLHAAVFLMLSSMAVVAHAQGGEPTDPRAAGLTSGDYIRVGGGIVTPVNAQGSFRDWNSGPGINVTWENWQPGSGGVGIVGYGLGVDYARLPLNEANFLSSFTPATGGTATSASGSAAQFFVVSTSLRVRIPMEYVVPSITIGLGFLNYRPSSVDYKSSTGNGTAKQESRSGGELSISGALDRQIIDRFAIFGEAQYLYGFTSLGRYAATPGGNCAANGCDVLKNTAVATLRGGLRVRLSQ